MRNKKMSDEARLAAVRDYLAGEESYAVVAARYGVSARTLRDLVLLYESQSEMALADQAQNQHYPPVLKRLAVEAAQTGAESQAAICRRYHIRSRSQLRSWIAKAEAAADAPNMSACCLYSAPGRTTTFAERVEIVGFCLAHGKNYALTIETYHISYHQIRDWVRKYLAEGATRLQDGRGRPKDTSRMTEPDILRAEIRLLRAEKHRLEVENAALKKLHEFERGWG